MEKPNEIHTIAGKRVRVERCANAADCCDRCCFIDRSSPRGCFARDNEKGSPACWHFEGEAYFVPAEDGEADLDAEIFAWQKAHATEETKQIIAMTARHFAKWGAEHADKPIYEVSSRGKSAMGDKFFDWLQFGTHAIWDWMVKTDWYKKLQDMSDELIVKIYLGKKRSKK